MSILIKIFFLVALLPITIQYLEILQQLPEGAVEQFLAQNGISMEEAQQLLNSEQGQQLVQKVMQGELSFLEVQGEAQKIIQQANTKSNGVSAKKEHGTKPGATLGENLLFKFQDLSQSQNLKPILQELAEDFLEEAYQVAFAPVAERLGTKDDVMPQTEPEIERVRIDDISKVDFIDPVKQPDSEEKSIIYDTDKSNNCDSLETSQAIFNLIVLVVCFVTI